LPGHGGGSGAGPVPAFLARPLVQVEELSTYLLRCAGNIAIDHLRSEGTRVRVNEGWQPDAPDSHGSEPQAALEAGNDLRHVEAALRALPERTRQIFCSIASTAASTQTSPRRWACPKVPWKNI
jgi:DNA-directed RNA polymerase specialized sigma24 family protein